MKWLLAALLISFAGCVDDSSLQSVEGYTFPVVGNGTTVSYEISIDLETNLGTIEDTNARWDIEYFYNDYMLDGEAYYLTVDAFDDYGRLELTRVEDRAMTWAYSQLEQSCEGCPVTLRIEHEETLEGYPVPLHSGQTWSFNDEGFISTNTVRGQMTIDTILGSRQAIVIDTEYGGQHLDESVSITQYIDKETGLDLLLEAAFSEDGTQVAARAELVHLQIMDVQRTEDEAIQLLAERLEVSSGGGDVWVQLDAPYGMDMDTELDVEIGVSSNAPVTIDVYFEGELLDVNVGPFTFAPDYPGMYQLVAMASSMGATAFDQADIYVDGTVSFANPCDAGLSEVEQLCQRIPFFVPSGDMSMRAASDGGSVPVQDTLTLTEPGGDSGTGTGDDGVAVTWSRFGGSETWQVELKPTVSVGANHPIDIRMDFIDPRPEAGEVVYSQALPLSWIG